MSSSPNSSTSGFERPIANEFLTNPSLRTVSSFFLGAVFIISLLFLFDSPAIRFLRQRLSVGFNLLFPKPPPNSRQLESNEGESKAKQWVIDTLLGDEDYNADPLNLVFILTVFAAVASVSMLGSLLTFSVSGHEALCSFVVAWGGMCAQAIRIVGLTKLSLDLRDLLGRRWEITVMWFLLFVAFVLMFVANAIRPGILVIVSVMDIALCYRQHYVVTAVLMSTLNLLLEFYSLIRLISVLVPDFLRVSHRVRALLDVRIGRAISLILMDIILVVPSAQFVSIPADVIPFAITLLIVLALFNFNDARGVTLTRTDSIPSTRMLRLERSSSDTYDTHRVTPSWTASRALSQTQSKAGESILIHRVSSPAPPPVPRKTASNGYLNFSAKVRQSLGISPPVAWDRRESGHPSLQRSDSGATVDAQYIEKLDFPSPPSGRPPSNRPAWPWMSTAAPAETEHVSLTSPVSGGVSQAQVRLPLGRPIAKTLPINMPDDTPPDPDTPRGDLGLVRAPQAKAVETRLLSRGVFNSMYIEEGDFAYPGSPPPLPTTPLNPPPGAQRPTKLKLRISGNPTLPGSRSQSMRKPKVEKEELSAQLLSAVSGVSLPSVVFGSDIVRSNSNKLRDYPEEEEPRTARMSIMGYTPSSYFARRESQLSYMISPENGTNISAALSAVDGKRNELTKGLRNRALTVDSTSVAPSVYGGLAESSEGHSKQSNSSKRSSKNSIASRASMRRALRRRTRSIEEMRESLLSNQQRQSSKNLPRLVVDNPPDTPPRSATTTTISDAMLSPPGMRSGMGVSTALRGSSRNRSRLMPRGPRSPEMDRMSSIDGITSVLSSGAESSSSKME